MLRPKSSSTTLFEIFLFVSVSSSSTLKTASKLTPLTYEGSKEFSICFFGGSSTS